MNLRFSDNAIRVRIERNELERLLTLPEERAREVSAKTEFPGGKTFTYRILVAPPAMISLQLQWRGEELLFLIPELQLQDMLARPPAKDVGCHQDLLLDNGGVLRVEIEVDLFSQKQKSHSKQDPASTRPGHLPNHL